MQPTIVRKQLAKMDPNPNFTIVPKDPDSTDTFYILLHPTGGHYSNQKHVLEFKTVYGHGDQKYYFPFHPPNVKFITSIYHTNISTSGSICLDILKDADKWSPQNTMETVMFTLIALLDDPNTSSPYNPDPSKHWSKCEMDYKEYIKGKKCDGKQALDIKSKIFADYDQVSDKYAAKNKLGQWGKYFPDLLDFDKLTLKD